MATAKSTNKKTTTRVKKRVSKNISHGQVHIKTSFNNTIVTFSDAAGNVQVFTVTTTFATSQSTRLNVYVLREIGLLENLDLKAPRKAHHLLHKLALKKQQRLQKNMDFPQLKFM